MGIKNFCFIFNFKNYYIDLQNVLFTWVLKIKISKVHLFCLSFLFHPGPDFELAEPARWSETLTTAACRAHCPCSFEPKALASGSCLSWACFYNQKHLEEDKNQWECGKGQRTVAPFDHWGHRITETRNARKILLLSCDLGNDNLNVSKVFHSKGKNSKFVPQINFPLPLYLYNS